MLWNHPFTADQSNENEKLPAVFVLFIIIIHMQQRIVLQQPKPVQADLWQSYSLKQKSIDRFWVSCGYEAINGLRNI